MKAKVTTAFPGRRDNSGESETLAIGDIVEGELAQVAIDNGWAEEVSEKVEETGEEKLLKAQEALANAQAAFDAAKTALDGADDTGKADAQKKHDAAETKLKAAQAKLDKLTKA